MKKRRKTETTDASNLVENTKESFLQDPHIPGAKPFLVNDLRAGKNRGNYFQLPREHTLVSYIVQYKCYAPVHFLHFHSFPFIQLHEVGAKTR